MSIIYTCRHCGQVVGKIEQQVMDAAVLGIDRLSAEDMKQMVQYQQNGNIHIQTICEDCETSLALNPEYHELDFFIQ